VRARIATRHPTQELAVETKLPVEHQNIRDGDKGIYSPIVNNEVRKRELVWVEQEWSDTKGQNGNPKVDQVRRPERERNVEEHEQRTHAEVDAGASKAREEDAERDPRRREATAGSDVPRTAEGQVVQDRMRVDLGGEDLKHRREGHELFAKSRERTASTTLNQFWIWHST
jgi:hypothetical protein